MDRKAGCDLAVEELDTEERRQEIHTCILRMGRMENGVQRSARPTIGTRMGKW
jgi:hypothetical protein